MRNNISAAALSEFADEVKHVPEEGIVQYGVGLDWQQGTRAVARARPMLVGNHRVNRDFVWMVDEPRQLLGTNHAPNPQEYLLSGLAACIMVSYAVAASVMAVQLDTLQVDVDAELDLAGFMGIGDCESGPFRRVAYRITVSGNGTDEQLEALGKKAVAHSPNAQTIARAVPLDGCVKVLHAETSGTG